MLAAKSIGPGEPANSLASCYTRPMTKSELVRCLSERFPALNAADAETAVNLILEQLTVHLSSGEPIRIRGLGQLSLDGTLPGKGLRRTKNSKVGLPDRHVANVDPAWKLQDGTNIALVSATSKRPKYRLDELLAQCSPDAPSPRIPGWDEMVSVGKEIL